MAFGYARVKPDAFSDITDVRMRNDRIMQDIANQKRNWEAQQAAAEFDAWQKQNARKDYGYYDKGLAIQNGFKTQPFAGQAPSISQGLARLGITPEGKLTFGSHGSNMVKPFRSKPIFKTDENGNVSPLSEDEKALLQKQSDATAQQAAAEAASGAPVQNGGNGDSSIENNVNPQASPWYDFLKHPQNTPYEQEQMRNQGILRDAAIAAAMNKPVFFPEADTLSEPMAKLAGQQNGLAQSAMQQLTARQGMAQNLFGQGANLITTLAGKSLESDLSAQTYFANAERELENSKIVKEQAEKLFKDNGVPEDIANKLKNSYGTPKFLEVVRSKELEKYQSVASQYDALLRSAAVLENSSNAWKQRGNAQLSKSKAYMQGASDVNKNLELGIDIKNDDAGYQPVTNYDKPQMVSQGGAGKNIGSPYIDGIGASQEQPIAPAKGNYAFVDGKVVEIPTKGNLSFIDGKVVPYTPKKVSGKPKSTEKDPVLQRLGNLLNMDVNIANFRKKGVRDHLDTYMQADADDTSRQKNILALASDISSAITKDVKNGAKYYDIIEKLVNNEARYPGVRAVFENNKNFNLPRSLSLSNYGDEIKKNTHQQGKLKILKDIYKSIEKGDLLSKANVDSLNELLTESFVTNNILGLQTPPLFNNGLKVKAKPVNIVGKDGKIEKTMYKVDLNDSFE